MNELQPVTKKGVKIGAILTALVGLTAATVLYDVVPMFEGKENVGYIDMVGVPTKCFGDTEDVVVGFLYTDEQCYESLERGLVKHAKPVLEATPVLKDHPMQLAAAVSLAYNIGASAYKNSTVARRFNSGDFKGACDAFLMWNKGTMGGKKSVIPGLTRRREQERAICLSDLGD